jgi:hypothetical protein
MSSAGTNDDNNNNFLSSTFTKNILDSHKSIRWVSIIDKNGTTINERFREGLKPFLNKEEMDEFAKGSITRYKTRLNLESKIGKLTYLLRRHEKLIRSIIPINESYYLFLTIDFEENNFDKLIMEKIIPLISQEKEKFPINNE